MYSGYFRCVFIEKSNIEDTVNPKQNRTKFRFSCFQISADILCYLLLEITTVSSNARWPSNGITIAGGKGNGRALNQLHYPYGLAVGDNDETIFIADSGNHRIVAWTQGDEEGRIVAGGNEVGKQLNQLNHPTDVLIDRETNALIICDWKNQRVMRWSRQIGTTHGEILFENVYCFGLTMDVEGSLYVTDEENNEVRRYQRGETKSRYTIVAGGKRRGDKLDQLNWPTNVFVDREGAVYVSDHINRRVMKWVKGATAGIVIAGGKHVRGNHIISDPGGIVVDTEGTLYIADYGNDQVTRWSKGANKGEIVVRGIVGIQKETQFNVPAGLSFDRHNNLYVVDYDNARVQRFDIV